MAIEHISKGPTSAVSGMPAPASIEEDTNGTASSGGAQPPLTSPLSSKGTDGSVFPKR